ncbi:MAG: PAS domain-containing protein [Bacillariaceae sp.]
MLIIHSTSPTTFILFSFHLSISDRHQLVQQVQRIGSGALGQQAASAVRHVAAQNGVWSLGNFGGVPPKSAMMYHQPSGPIADEPTSSPDSASSLNGSTLPSKIEESDYRQVFNSCTIGMAIASMGGAFIDCNKLFCNISNYTKQEICSMTVFNLTSRQDLQSAFDLISQMLSAPIDPTVTNTSCVLRGALKSRTDIGLNVKLIKGGDGVAKCFCVTLIMNPASPYDTSKPTPATMGHGIANTGQILPGPTAKGSSQAGLAPSPAYTTG